MTTSALRPAVPLLGALALTLLAGATHYSPPRVTIDTGTLEGIDTAGVAIFRGVPYAAPPVGSLRWKPPQPAKSWSGVRRASALGHNCIQHQPYGDINADIAGISEDCLYLNVYTTGLDTRATR